MKFNELTLHVDLMRGIQNANYITCTDVQERTFQYTLSGRDVCVQSQTGTGKTAAFLISIFHLLLNEPLYATRQVLIIVPTRELADQIEKEAKLLGTFLDFKIGSLFGGVGYQKQEEFLANGANIIIGTPGRLLDLAQSKKLDFSNIGILVIDEADRLFDMGFYPDIRRMLKKMVAPEQRMTMLFSATLGAKSTHLSWEYMNNPAEVEIVTQNVTVDLISQCVYHVGKEDKMRLLLGLIKSENPQSMIIFTSTKHCGFELAERLRVNGFSSEYLGGDINQKKRLKIVDNLKTGELKFLVATDVAARGLHVDDLDLVINYDLPNNPENYVHRIGRTARAGKSGKSISFASEFDVYNLPAIEKFINQTIPVMSVEESMLYPDASRGMVFQEMSGDRVNRGRNDRRRSDGRSDKRDQNRGSREGNRKSQREGRPNPIVMETRKSSDEQGRSSQSNSRNRNNENRNRSNDQRQRTNQQGEPRRPNNQNGNSNQRNGQAKTSKPGSEGVNPNRNRSRHHKFDRKNGHTPNPRNKAIQPKSEGVVAKVKGFFKKLVGG